MKIKPMNALEKNLVAKLRTAEEKRRARALSTLGAYVIKIKGFYTLPFFAPTDDVAIDCAVSLIREEKLESTLPEIYCIGDFCLIDAKMHSIAPRFLPFQLIARPPKRPLPSAPKAEGHNKSAPKK